MAQDGGRPPPKYVRCLLPIWGYRFVRQFLDVSLPTWLAGGNLPALAAHLPTEFVLLTSREDETFIRCHPMFAELKRVCADHDPLHRSFDHQQQRYSTTITLAYTEYVRSTGQDMLDTCFFFLVSDYIVADHSFSNVLPNAHDGRMQRGSGRQFPGRACRKRRSRGCSGTAQRRIRRHQFSAARVDALGPVQIFILRPSPIS